MIFAFLRKSPFFEKSLQGEEYGMYNGYVAFDADLPESYQSSWGYDEQSRLDDVVRPHGGITFDRMITPTFGEIIPLTAIPDPELWKDGIRCVGFDTAHYGDNGKIWNFETCKREALDMMREIQSFIDSDE